MDCKQYGVYAISGCAMGAGDKTGDDRWYETNVPVADRLFERHLEWIEKERSEHG
jgi:hypothetical protein